jgi:hypothetical protein
MRRHGYNISELKHLKMSIMKHPPRTRSILCATAFCAAVLAGPSARANLITGSIGFGAEGVTIDSPNLATATTFGVAIPFVTTDSGVYSIVPLLTDVTFHGFEFNPPAASVTPLWTFQILSTVYSFDATSVTSSYNSSLEQWDIGGDGMAMVTGYTATEGTWNVNLSQSGDSFVFDASEASVTVTEHASTLSLLGSAFIGLVALGRKFRC